MKATAILFMTLIVLSTTTARASPLEDAIEGGDIDGEDVALRRESERPTRDFARDVGVPNSARVLGKPSAETWLSLVGFMSPFERGGMVTIGFPFDRAARGNTRATTAPEFENVGLTQPPSPEAPFDIALPTKLARSCVAAAWRSAGVGVDDSRLDAIVSRAHWSAVLPETRLRAIRYDNAYLLSSLDSVNSAPTYLHDSSGANVGLEARVTWRLDRLIYADDEPALERIRLEQRDARSRIAAHVLEVLFHWQRAVLDLKTLPPGQVGTRDEADVQLRIMEAEAALDVLTNGWFSAHRPKRPGPPAPPTQPATSW